MTDKSKDLRRDMIMLSYFIFGVYYDWISRQIIYLIKVFYPTEREINEFHLKSDIVLFYLNIIKQLYLTL